MSPKINIFDVEEGQSTGNLGATTESKRSDSIRNQFPLSPISDKAFSEEKMPNILSTPMMITNGGRRRAMSEQKPPTQSHSVTGEGPPGFRSRGGSVGAAASFSQQGSLGKFMDKRVILYKTEMCRAYEETGQCKYGERCQFAHCQAELRPANKHPRYKTEICRTFWEQGTCPYGKRCCFIHNENPNELKGSLPTSPVDATPGTSANGESKVLHILSKFSSSPIFEHSTSWCAKHQIKETLSELEQLDYGFERAPGSHLIPAAVNFTNDPEQLVEDLMQSSDDQGDGADGAVHEMDL